MSGFKSALGLALGISLAALISGCDNGPSAVSKKPAEPQVATAEGPGPTTNYRSRDDAPRVDHRRDAAPLADDGKPLWASSRRYSAQEGAERAFDRNGDAFGAKTLNDFVKKAHAFVGHPPKGVLTLTRANGDTLYYDPKSNVFAVSGKDGAPRTMFKPDDGMDYWQKQTERESKRQARTGRSHGGNDDA